MKKNLVTAVLMTIATTVLLGIIYPLVVTGIAQVLFPKKANGQLIEANGKIIGSRIIAQAFTAPAISTLVRRPLAMTLQTPTDRSWDQQIRNLLIE